MNRIPENQPSKVDKYLKDMPPFSIVIRTPKEAEFLFDSVLLKLFGKTAPDVAELMQMYTSTYGRLEGPTKFVADCKERGYPMPEWFAPLMTLIVDTVKKNHENKTPE